MVSLSTSLTTLSSYHLISWGSLLGTQLYQTFVITKVNYLYLPRPQFKTLQKHAFPIYFRISAALAAVTAVTYPSGSIFALPSNRIDFTLLSLTLAVSGLNLLVYGPKTIEAMVLKTHQESREGIKPDANEESTSKEMRLAKQRFSHNHAMSIHLNLIGVISTVVYGISLGSRIV